MGFSLKVCSITCFFLEFVYFAMELLILDQLFQENAPWDFFTYYPRKKREDVVEGVNSKSLDTYEWKLKSIEGLENLAQLLDV